MSVYLQKLPTHSSLHFQGCAFRGDQVGMQSHIWFRTLHAGLFTCYNRSRHLAPWRTDQLLCRVPSAVFFMHIEIARLSAIVAECMQDATPAQWVHLGCCSLLHLLHKREPGLASSWPRPPALVSDGHFPSSVWLGLRVVIARRRASGWHLGYSHYHWNKRQ